MRGSSQGPATRSSVIIGSRLAWKASARRNPAAGSSPAYSATCLDSSGEQRLHTAQVAGSIPAQGTNAGILSAGMRAGRMALAHRQGRRESPAPNRTSLLFQTETGISLRSSGALCR